MKHQIRNDDGEDEAEESVSKSQVSNVDVDARSVATDGCHGNDDDSVAKDAKETHDADDCDVKTRECQSEFHWIVGCCVPCSRCPILKFQRKRS